MKKHCSLWELYDYHKNEVDESERQKIEAHLNQCSECNNELEEIKKIITIFSAWSVPEFPSEIDNKVGEALQKHRISKFSTFIQRLFYPFYIKIPLLATVLAGLVFVSVIAYKSSFISEGERISKEFPFIAFSGAREPIIWEVENVEGAYLDLIRKVVSHGGKIIRKKGKEIIEVTLSIEKEKERDFLEDLRGIGRVKIGKRYKDGEGNIVVIIKASKKAVEKRE